MGCPFNGHVLMLLKMTFKFLKIINFNGFIKPLKLGSIKN
jgi:hypothetical protein